VKNVNRLDKFLRRRGNLFRLSHHSPIEQIATAQQTFFFGSKLIMRLAMTAPFDRSPIDEIATAQKTFFIGFKIHNEPRNDDSSRPTPSSTSLRGAVKNVNRLDKFLRRRGNLFRLSPILLLDRLPRRNKHFSSLQDS